MTRFRKELWTLTSFEREIKGRCFGDLVIVPESVTVAEEGSKINRFAYTLKKSSKSLSASFLDSQIGVGEPIVISDEIGHFGLAKGFVTAIRRSAITVAVDRRIHNARVREEGFNPQYNQVFTGIMTVGPKNKNKKVVPPANKLDTQALFRLDKDELSNGMALVRNNLIQLLSPTTSGRIRELIIDLDAPNFRDSSTAYPLEDIMAHLNGDQQRAIEKIMSAEDYALILGMPGTGKTTTIAYIIRALVSQGKSVLLTSYTHNAVDNILLKIKGDGISVLRLGNVMKVSRNEWV